MRPLFFSHFQRLTKPSVLAITLGAGVQWGDAYDFAQKQGRTIVGGISGTVGAAGGWVMGGGHGILSPKLGLGMPPPFLFILHDKIHDLVTY